jgi:hypothetical protein
MLVKLIGEDWSGIGSRLSTATITVSSMAVTNTVSSVAVTKNLVRTGPGMEGKGCDVCTTDRGDGGSLAGLEVSLGPLKGSG